MLLRASAAAGPGAGAVAVVELASLVDVAAAVAHILAVAADVARLVAAAGESTEGLLGVVSGGGHVTTNPV